MTFRLLCLPPNSAPIVQIKPLKWELDDRFNMSLLWISKQIQTHVCYFKEFKDERFCPLNKYVPSHRGTTYVLCTHSSTKAPLDFDYIHDQAATLQLVTLFYDFTMVDRKLRNLVHHVPLNLLTDVISRPEVQSLLEKQARIMQRALLLPRRRCVRHPIFEPFTSIAMVLENRHGVRFRLIDSKKKVGCLMYTECADLAFTFS